LKKQLEQLQAKSASGEVDQLLAQATQWGSTRMITGESVPNAQGIKYLRDLSDRLKQKAADSVIVLG
jgi:hypothetical protein